MAWNGYIDNLVAQTKDAAGTAHADKACIIGLDGGAKWTTDDHANAFKVICYRTAVHGHKFFITLAINVSFR